MKNTGSYEFHFESEHETPTIIEIDYWRNDIRTGQDEWQTHERNSSFAISSVMINENYVTNFSHDLLELQINEYMD